MEYGITAVSLAPYNFDTVAKILRNGSQIGCIYYDFILGERYEESPILTPEEAADKVIKGDEDNMHCIYTRYEDTYFHMFFRPDTNNCTDISIGPFGYEWIKDFINNYECLDAARYMKFLLKLVSVLPLVRVEIESDDF